MLPPLRLASLAAVASAALCLSGCGLESVTYYSPPTFAYAGNILTLTHNSDNSDSSFLGYDIYYRAFGTLAEANTARASIESATNATTSTPESVLALLAANSFKKVYRATAPTTAPSPLLDEGATTYYMYLANDSSTTNWYYITNIDATHVEIVRGTGNGDSFNDSYLAGDVDYGSTTMSVTSKGSVYIVAFAVAFGYDFTNLKSTYSFPASLYQPIGGSNGYSLP
jgi:hypothetical protein